MSRAAGQGQGRGQATGPDRRPAPVDLGARPGGSVLERTLVAMLAAYRRCPLGPAGADPGATGGLSAADRLAAAGPGPGLARLLDGLDATGLDPGYAGTDTLVEGIAAWERLVAWATARQAELITALDAREHRAGRAEFVTDAISTRLGSTRHAARVKKDLADALALYPPVATALRTGAIDPAKARVFTDELAAAPASVSDALLDTFLPDAARLTGPQLRSRLRRAAQAVDPTLSARRAAAEAERRGVRLTPAPDSMAYLTAYLPADDAAVCLAALDALADTAAGSAADGDARTPDARRADALTDTLRAVLDTGRTPSGEALTTRQRRRPHIQVTVAATTLLGLDDQPADLAGYGPVPAALARAIAQDGTWRALITDAHGQVVARSASTYRPGADLTGTVTARDDTCRFPGCRAPAHRCDLDHISPYTPARPAGEQTTPENLHALCRHHHRLKTHTTWTVTRDPGTGTTTWTTPWGRTYRRDPEPIPGPPPEIGAREVLAPESTNPEATSPESTRPESTRPESTRPESTTPIDLGPPPF